MVIDGHVTNVTHTTTSTSYQYLKETVTFKQATIFNILYIHATFDPHPPKYTEIYLYFVYNFFFWIWNICTAFGSFWEGERIMF